MKKLDNLIKMTLISLIQVYRYSLSYLFPRSCRFHPSCSEYAIDALKSYGALKGSWLTVKRLAKCHPFHPGGYDSVK